MKSDLVLEMDEATQILQTVGDLIRRVEANTNPTD